LAIDPTLPVKKPTDPNPGFSLEFRSDAIPAGLIAVGLWMGRREFLQSLGVAVISAGATYLTVKKTSLSIGTYVQMGTSVTSGVTPSANITPSIVGDRLGILGINAGMPGACAGRNKYPEIEHRSLYCLVDSIVSGSWTAQNSESDPSLKSNLFHLMTADLSKVTYLGLEYGTNDFSYSRPLGINQDATPDTFKGALNYSLKKLATAFPHLRLFLITPAWRLNNEEQDSDTHPNDLGIFLKEYVDGMLDIAVLHHVPCLDMWRVLGTNIDNYKTLTFDGTHPNPEGAQRRGEVIASFIKAAF
jgi:lysophospholipase L1-like esterase